MSAPETRILPADAEGIAVAARLIRAGEPVAVPTETVYGLAADATNGEAVARIYAAKGRPSFNPLIVHVLDLAHARDIGAIFNEVGATIAEQYWPGPLTMVVPLNPFSHLDRRVTAGLGTVAVRAAKHPVIRRLIERSGRPLAAPSANRSGSISPTSASHVRTTLTGRISLILDGGPTQHGIESTIVKLAGSEILTLRPGPIDGDTVAVFAKVLHDFVSWSGRIEAPGQLASHYAPAKPLRLNATAAAADEWLIGFGDVPGHASLSPGGDLVEAAANLFALLHDADRRAPPRIAVAPIPHDGLGVAINDRLARAAAPPQSP